MIIVSIITIVIQIIAIIAAINLIRRNSKIAWLFVATTYLLFSIKIVLSSNNIIQLDALIESLFLITNILLLILVLFNSHILNTMNHSVRELKMFVDIDRVMLSSLSYKGTMNAIIDKLIQTINPDAIGIYHVDTDGQRLNILSSYNLSEEFRKQSISINCEPIKTIFEKKKPLIIHKTGNDKDIGYLTLLRQEGFVVCLWTPIITKGSVPIGVLIICLKRPRRFPKRDIEFVNAISNQMAIILDRGQFIKRIHDMNLETVLAVAETIEMRDPCTRGHSLQVANLSVAIARTMEFSKRELELIEFAGLLHDVGKIAVPEAILQKATILSDDEWEIIKKHPEQSVRIIKPIKNLREIQTWILHHHERWDGTGYPEKIKGERIPIQARILAVSDTFSAMTCDRPYRQGVSIAEAKEEIKRVLGSQLDPTIVRIFLSLDLDMLERKQSSGLYVEGQENSPADA